MPTRFSLRMQFGPHADPDDISSQLLDLVRRAPVDEINFFFFAEEQNDGHDPLDRIRLWLDRSRPYRERLRKAGVNISLNPWHSLLHCDRGRRLKPGQDWQRMMDPAGREARAVVCPLDPAWREYFFETLRLYAREGFRVVWIDDDIRYHNHSPLEWGGCFCPMHVAEFNRRTGVDARREDIVKACLAPGQPHPWRAAWFDMWQDTLLEMLDDCRGILEAHGTDMGLMSSVPEAHGAEGRRWNDWWRTFGGDRPPVHRPSFWPYADTSAMALIDGIGSLDQARATHPPGTQCDPEIENGPYGPWNKSFRQIAAQMAVAQILGATGLQISLFDFMGNRVEDEPDRAEFLRRIRPNLDWLADRFPPALRTVGVDVLWREDMGRAIRTECGASWNELRCPSRGWAGWLGAAGFAFSTRGGGRVQALSGPMAWSLTDADLEAALAGGLLLDGPAAAILFERGRGDAIGLESCRWITQDDVLYSIEECTDPTFALRAGAQISVNGKAYAHRLLQGALAADARVISDLRDPLQNVVGHGAWLVRNSRGGRVAVVPWDAGNPWETQMHIQRAVQLRRIAAWLADNRPTGAVTGEGGAWIVPQFLTDGTAWRGALWNAGPDDVTRLHVERPDGMPPATEAWHLTPDGRRTAVPIDGDSLTPTEPLRQWEVIVLW